MKSCKSYTCKISGNNVKTNFLEEQLEIIEDLSWYIFNINKRFPKQNYWYYQKKLYHSCRRFFPELNSKILQNFMSLYKPIKGKKNPKKQIKPSIYLDQSFNVQYKDDTKLTNFWLRFSKKNFPLFGKYLKNKLLDLSKIKLVQIFKKKNQLYCKLIYIEEIEEPTNISSNPKIVGLDVNTKRIILSNNKFYSIKRLFHSKIEHHKNNQKKRNKSNYTKDFLHKLTTQIVDDLQQEGVEVLILEDLKNLRKSASRKLGTSKGRFMNYVINSMSFGMFRDFLKYKCLDRGINVQTINPAYTSKTCSKCGSRNSSRQKQTDFICNDCGFKLDADLNGSRNIWSFYKNSKWATSESSPGLDL